MPFSLHPHMLRHACGANDGPELAPVSTGHPAPATSGEISVDWRPSPAPRVGTGTVRRISNELGWGQMRPPGSGDFWILKIAYAPSDKNLSKKWSCP